MFLPCNKYILKHTFIRQLHLVMVASMIQALISLKSN